jgi:pimeloyl-ACP methyl ester carboxylesterase
MHLKTAVIAMSALLATEGNVFAKDMPAVSSPLTIIDQGSFAVGGAVKVETGTFDPRKPLDPAGQSHHGDHASVFYQVPQHARHLVVMLHGAGQSARSWETTPDGREGFQTLFLRQHYATYLIDQPRRGEAGRSMVEGAVKPQGDEQLWFNQFRVGLWPNHFDGVQFDRGSETLNQFFRAMAPNTGPFDMGLVAQGTSALFDRIGPAILFTHSQGGGPGWMTAIRNPRVRAVVAFEPGSSFIFPEGELPAPIPSAFDTVKGRPCRWSASWRSPKSRS